MLIKALNGSLVSFGVNLNEGGAWRLSRQCFHFSIKEEFVWCLTRDRSQTQAAGREGPL